MRTHWKLAAGTLAAAGALAVPASASAAITTQSLAACYQTTDSGYVSPISVTLNGGTPGDTFNLQATGDGVNTDINGASPFDASGTGTVTLPRFLVPLDALSAIPGKQVALTAKDYNDEAPNGGTSYSLGNILVTQRILDIANGPAGPYKARAVSMSGTAFAHKKLYGFITNKAGSKVIRHFFFGTGNACGYAEHKEVVVPDTGADVYELFINAGPKLNKKASISTPVSVNEF